MVNAADSSGAGTGPESTERHGALLPPSRATRRQATHHVSAAGGPRRREPPADNGTARLFGWRRRSVDPETEPMSPLETTAATGPDLPAARPPVGAVAPGDDEQLCHLVEPKLAVSIYNDPREARHAPFGADDALPQPALSYSPPPLAGVPYDEATRPEPASFRETATAPVKPVPKPVLRVREIAPIATVVPAPALPPPPAKPLAVPVLRAPPVPLKATPLSAPVTLGARPGARADEVVVKPPQPPGRFASRRGKRSGKSL
jgi:hypothetical protein